MRILVTGGAGFIGSHLVDALVKEGHDLVVVDDFSNGKEDNLAEAKSLAAQNGTQFKILRASLADPNVWTSMEECQAVFHTASHTSVVQSVYNPGQDFQANIDPIPNLLKYIRSKKVKYFLMASSGGTVYGDAPYFPTDERALVSPLSPHGVTKAFLEIYLQAWTSALKSSGEIGDDISSDKYFSWASLRLGNVYGPRQVKNNDGCVVPLFIDDLMTGRQPVIYGDGSKTRDYVYVGDVVSAFMASFTELQRMKLDGIYNVATGKETKDLEVLDQIVAEMQSQFPKLKKLNSKPKMEKRRPGEVERSLLDVNKIATFLGWTAQVDFAQGIKLTVEAYNKANARKT